MNFSACHYEGEGQDFVCDAGLNDIGNEFPVAITGTAVNSGTIIGCNMQIRH